MDLIKLGKLLECKRKELKLSLRDAGNLIGVCNPIIMQHPKYTESMHKLTLMCDTSTIGGRIKYYRLKNSLSQKELSYKSGLDRCTINRYENNQVEYSLENINQISKALNIDVDLLYDDYLRFIASDPGGKLNYTRKRLGLLQKDFSKLIGVHKETYRMWELNKVRPSRENYKILKKYMR